MVARHCILAGKATRLQVEMKGDRQSMLRSVVVFVDQCVWTPIRPYNWGYIYTMHLYIWQRPVMDLQTCKSPNKMLSLFFLQCSILSRLSALSNLYLMCVIVVTWLYWVFCVSSSRCHTTNGTARKRHRTQSGLWSVVCYRGISWPYSLFYYP